MKSVPLHNSFMVPVDECIDRIPNELAVDAVGLWQIVPTFSKDFGLSGSDLRYYTKRAIEALISRGAVPVEFPDSNEARDDLMKNGKVDVDRIMEYLDSLGREPTVDDIWLELPQSSKG